MDGFDRRKILFHRLNESLDVEAQVNRPVRLDLLQAGMPQFDGPRRHALLPFEVTGGDLNDALVKFPFLSMLLEPDLLERLVTLEEKPLVELIDALENTGIVLGFHQLGCPCTMK